MNWKLKGFFIKGIGLSMDKRIQQFSVVLVIPADLGAVDSLWLVENGIFSKEDLKANNTNSAPGCANFRNSDFALQKTPDKIIFQFISQKSRTFAFISPKLEPFGERYKPSALGLNFVSFVPFSLMKKFYADQNPVYHLFDREKDSFSLSITSDKGNHNENVSFAPVKNAKGEQAFMVSINDHYPIKAEGSFSQILADMNGLEARFLEVLTTLEEDK